MSALGYFRTLLTGQYGLFRIRRSPAEAGLRLGERWKNHYRVDCGVGTPKSGIAPGAAGGVERVIAGESLLAVVVRSVLLELNIIRAPTMKAIEATAASALQPEPVSSNGTL